jgi:hypothetical protein
MKQIIVFGVDRPVWCRTKTNNQYQQSKNSQNKNRKKLFGKLKLEF